MHYYHVLIIKKNDGTAPVFALDLSLKEVQERIIFPLTQWKPFICGNSPIQPSQIDHYRISVTEETSAVIRARTKKKRIATKILGQLADDRRAGYVDQYCVFDLGRDVTKELVKGVDITNKESTVLGRSGDGFPERQSREQPMTMEYEKFRQKIVGLQSDLSLFKADFFDRDGFKQFADNLPSEVGGWTEICVTGYFSETIRDALEKIIRMQGRKLKLISQEIDMNNKRDRKNLEVLRKLCSLGAEIKINSRLHARFLVAYHPEQSESRGLLIIGSFDFNTECVGKERYDAGIRTGHPELVSSARRLFEEMWNDHESISLNDKYK